jgi:hypothetical protein
MCASNGTLGGCFQRPALMAAKHVPLSANKPTEIPYFITYGYGKFDDFCADTVQMQHVGCPGVPLTQVVESASNGHDLHQIMEHAIGCIKGHTRRMLSKARATRKPLTTRETSEACGLVHVDGMLYSPIASQVRSCIVQRRFALL